jgi:hypothetical protein
MYWGERTFRGNLNVGAGSARVFLTSYKTYNFNKLAIIDAYFITEKLQAHTTTALSQLYLF